MLLKDKVTLITGAGRGLGQAVAVAYAHEGAQVIAVARTQSELDHTEELIHQQGGRVLTLRGDVANESAMSAMAGYVLQRFGRLDVLVNNAGQLLLKPFAEMSIEEWDNILSVNLRGPVLACKLFLEAMKRQGGGSIINVSSNAGVMGFVRESAYCTSKFGLEGFSRALAMEVREYNIAVNTATPGKLPGGATIKPTSITQAQFDSMGPSERLLWADASLLIEAFIYLALQRGDGLTGRRVPAFELSELIRQQGWEIDPLGAISGS